MSRGEGACIKTSKACTFILTSHDFLWFLDENDSSSQLCRRLGRMLHSVLESLNH